MKKIYLDMQPTWRKKTGIGWYTYNLVDELNKKNKNDYILLGGLFNPLGIVKNFMKVPNLNYKEIKYFWPFYNYGGIFSKKFLKWKFINFNKITNTKHDIYHFFNFTMPHNVKGKTIVTIHDIIYKIMPEVVDFDKEAFDNEVRYSLENSDIVITVSNSAKKDILRYFEVENPQKILVVEPGIDLCSYKTTYKDTELENLKEKYNINSENEIILYIGTVEKRKNIINLIKAFNICKAQNNKLTLIIAGGKGLDYNKIEEEKNGSPYKEDIKMLGYISEIEKLMLYKLAKVFVFPSYYEGFGMPILEAMASGTPVITSNTSSLPEASGDAGILVNPSSVPELSSAILKIIENFELRNELIQKGYKHVKKFTWEKSAEKIKKIYEKL